MNQVTTKKEGALAINMFEADAKVNVSLIVAPVDPVITILPTTPILKKLSSSFQVQQTKIPIGLLAL